MFPRIHGLPPIPPVAVARPADPTLHLIQQGLRTWCTALPDVERRELLTQWTAIRRDEVASGTTPHARPIFELLRRIDATHPSDHQREQGVAMLRATAQDATFRAACGAQAQLALEDCHDNALVQFETICRLLPFQAARTTAEFVDAARGKAVGDLLREFVAARYPGHREATEIFLYLMVALGPALGLPPSHMRYERFAVQLLGDQADRVVDDALRHVGQHLDDARIANTLLEVPSWEAHVKERMRDDLDRCFAPIQDRVDGVVFGEHMPEVADMSGERIGRRLDGLRNIQENLETAALARLTALCVAASRSPPSNVTENVQARLPDDAGFGSIMQRVAAQAEQWSRPTEALVPEHWGRRDRAGDPARADPMRDHLHRRQREAQAAAAPPQRPPAAPAQASAEPRVAPHVPPPAAIGAAAHARAAGEVTQLQRDPEAMQLQRALEDSMAALRGQPRGGADPARAGGLGIAQALDVLRGDRRHATTGVDRADLALGEVGRRAWSTRLPDPPYMVAPATLYDLVSQSAGIGRDDVAQREMALTGDAALLDIIRARVKSDPTKAAAVLGALTWRVGPRWPTSLQTIVRTIARSAPDRDVLIAQARLGTSLAFLLRRLSMSLTPAHIRAGISGDRALFAGEPDRTTAAPLGVLAMRLHAFGFGPYSPLEAPPDAERLHALEGATNVRIRSIDDAALRQAHGPTLDPGERGEQLAAIVLDRARRVSAGP